jgi:hypothetical protein
MIAQDDQVIDTVNLTPEDQAVLRAKLLQAMQASMYSNRMQVAPRRIKEMAQAEIALMQEFLVTRAQQMIYEHGMVLAREGLGQKSVVGIASALRLGLLEVVRQSPEFMALVNLAEEYTAALLNGYMAAYEEEQRREQQRAHEAFVRSIGNA